ncbi:protease inhibitor I42 family protein [Candidatus Omnitrophota bacterium]
MKKIISLIIVFAVIGASPAFSLKVVEPSDSNVIIVTGTMKRFSSEGGFFGIEGDNGVVYKPVRLTSSFHIEGLRVKFSGRLKERKLISSGWYRAVKIDDIERLPRMQEHSDPAKPIEVRRGKQFVISLESNPTTGYGWQLAEPPDTDIIELVDSYYIADATDRVGAGGKVKWTFKAVDSGKAAVSLKYVRPWEKNVPSMKTVKFEVIVQ